MPSACHLPHRALLKVSGRDTFKYLQTQTTNNLKTPSSQYTCFLNAAGRVLHDAFIYRTAEDACLVEVDAARMEAFKEHLMRYKLRSKIKLETVDAQDLSVFSVCAETAETLDKTAPWLRNCHHQRDVRGPAMGLRVLGSPSAVPAVLDVEPLYRYTTRRYLQGIPEGHAELGEATALPLESNLDLMQGVDFHKGCYLGQELTVRTHHTGVIRKRILPVRFAASNEALPASLEEGLDVGEGNVLYSNEKREIKTAGVGRPAGKVLAQLGNLGLALFRLEKLEAGPAQVRDESTLLKAFLPLHWSNNIIS